MNNIILHGKLADLYGAVHELEISSPREAIRALCLTIDGIAETIRDGSWRVVRGDADKGLDLDEDMLDIGMGETELHIIPAIAGAGGGGMGKIIVGIIMIAAAFFTGGASLAAWGAMATGMAVMGGALIIGGISTMAAQPPATDVDARSESNGESFLFDGPVNVTAQGGPVPLIYGEMIVGSTVISSGLSVEDIPFEQSEEDRIMSEIKGVIND